MSQLKSLSEAADVLSEMNVLCAAVPAFVTAWIPGKADEDDVLNTVAMSLPNAVVEPLTTRSGAVAALNV